MEDRIINALNMAEEEGYITPYMSYDEIEDMSYEILEFEFDEMEIDSITDDDFESAWESWSC